LEATSIISVPDSFAPPAFSGTNADPDTWLAHFQRYVEYRQLPDDDVVAIFPLFLKDSAIDWYDNLTCNVKTDLKSLLDNFKAYFGKSPLDYVFEEQSIFTRAQRPKASHQKSLFTADGKAMHVLGTIQLMLVIHEFQIPLTFCVLPRLQFAIILGVHFLRQMKANIDMQLQILMLYGDLVGTNLLNETDTIVPTTEAVLISPRSEAIIPVMVPPVFGPGL